MLAGDWVWRLRSLLYALGRCCAELLFKFQCTSPAIANSSLAFLATSLFLTILSVAIEPQVLIVWSRLIFWLNSTDALLPQWLFQVGTNNLKITLSQNNLIHNKLFSDLRQMPKIRFCKERTLICTQWQFCLGRKRWQESTRRLLQFEWVMNESGTDWSLGFCFVFLLNWRATACLLSKKYSNSELLLYHSSALQAL